VGVFVLAAKCLGQLNLTAPHSSLIQSDPLTAESVPPMIASRDLATWVVAPPALVPGRWGGPVGRVGEPAGNATEGYYSGSATIVGGTPRIIIPAVFFKPGDQHSCPVKCEDPDSW
jgi:hypothetical protein